MPVCYNSTSKQSQDNAESNGVAMAETEVPEQPEQSEPKKNRSHLFGHGKPSPGAPKGNKNASKSGSGKSRNVPQLLRDMRQVYGRAKDYDHPRVKPLRKMYEENFDDFYKQMSALESKFSSGVAKAHAKLEEAEILKDAHDRGGTIDQGSQNVLDLIAKLRKRMNDTRPADPQP